MVERVNGERLEVRESMGIVWSGSGWSRSGHVMVA